MGTMTDAARDQLASELAALEDAADAGMEPADFERAFDKIMGGLTTRQQAEVFVRYAALKGRTVAALCSDGSII